MRFMFYDQKTLAHCSHNIPIIVEDLNSMIINAHRNIKNTENVKPIEFIV